MNKRQRKKRQNKITAAMINYLMLAKLRCMFIDAEFQEEKEFREKLEGLMKIEIDKEDPAKINMSVPLIYRDDLL